MKSGTILIFYGLFLIVAGMAGFLSNPEKAKTALMSGGTFGLIQIVVGTISLKGWKPARKLGIGICAFLALTFTWRSIVSWMAVAGGQSEKIFAASLISTMLAASIVAIILLIKQKPSAA
ncbi:TMEM14 family protein [Haloferula sp.]|uniref:TMEM14 family protein n=1 Tax=Haloferula sp. TaxID=2497595 RepID=UPI003C72ECFE